ncbi:sulfite exporter TauE/SafE family protein [Salibaculum griseiflavum]|jgi:hypothetical protein|uniref:Probable membrane transporter protein n=1 Tax=Salibaculum griseiflavum TaxID=1914409 RepID=A0A2V1P7M2_9RHOB|nr:sulfite exporter TauE/SafE family protein [Salibaculum griseiflavum]PWG18523.1 hypothetical protein DFK10_00965 [Salibaculum griseiflavum]
MDIFASIDSAALLAAVIAVTLLAGVVKGAVGFAMPLIMVSGLGMLLEPRIAVAALILPIVMSNGLQVLRAGLDEAMQAIRDYWLYLLIVCTMILISAQFLTVIPTDTMFLVLGIPVVLLCAIQLLGLRLSIPENRRTLGAVIAGFLSGAMGGLAGTWGPPTVLYLVAIDTPKARQLVVQGVIYGLGSVMLLLGHLQSGVLNRDTVGLSAFLIIPAAFGMWAGFKLQDRIDQATFRKVTLLVLLLAGLNLIRRGLV